MGGLDRRDSIRYTRTAGEGVQDFYVTTNGLSAGLPFAVAPPRLGGCSGSARKSVFCRASAVLLLCADEQCFFRWMSCGPTGNIREECFLCIELDAGRGHGDVS